MRKEGKQLTLEGYRIRRIDEMLGVLGVKHAKSYRRKMVMLFKDNTRPRGSAEERLYDHVEFKLQLKHENNH